MVTVAAATTLSAAQVALRCVAQIALRCVAQIALRWGSVVARVIRMLSTL